VLGGDSDRNPREATWYSYAIVRVVPRVERGECLNVGVILFARTHGFLEMRVEVDASPLHTLWPGLDLDEIERHLTAFQLVCAGDPAGGPIAAMDRSARFHWLTSPRSTLIQTSPVHIGCCDDPAAALEQLTSSLVRRPRDPSEAER
jgi:hypothetical protein